MADNTPTRDIQGDVSVGRDTAIGGTAEIQGNVIIEHDCRIKGYLYADNVNSLYKGVHLTLDALKEAHKRPKPGEYAHVGSSSPFAQYIESNGVWVATGGVSNVTTDTAAIDTLRGEVADLTAALALANEQLASQTAQLEKLNELYGEVSTAKIRTITVTSANSSMGSVSGGGRYASGVVATITATPATGYHFVKWADGDTRDVRPITIVGNAEYEAQFAINSYQVTAVAEDSSKGSVSGGGSVNHGGSVTLTATPATGYTFVGWYNGGTLASSNASYTITSLSGPISLVARFTDTTYNVVVESSNSILGTATGGRRYKHGETAVLVATANLNGLFTGWRVNGAIVSAATTYSFVVTADVTVTAVFSTAVAEQYDYYIGYSDETDPAQFAALSSDNLRYGIKGFTKVAHPTFSGYFAKKVIYLLYRASSAPTSGTLNASSALPTQYSSADFLDATKWPYVHTAIVIDGITYNVIGIGGYMFTSNNTIDINF